MPSQEVDEFGEPLRPIGRLHLWAVKIPLSMFAMSCLAALILPRKEGLYLGLLFLSLAVVTSIIANVIGICCYLAGSRRASDMTMLLCVGALVAWLIAAMG